MPLPGIRAARSFLDELQRDLLETEDQDFDGLLDRWSALGVPEIDEYRGERRRSRGELISEVNRTRRAIEKRPELLREEEAGETPILTGTRRIARGAEVLRGLMEGGGNGAPMLVPASAPNFSQTAPQFAAKGNVNVSGPFAPTVGIAVVEPVDFEAETGDTPHLDDGFATGEPDGLANVGDVSLPGGLPEQVSIAPALPGPFDGEGEDFYLGSRIPGAELPEDEPDDPESAGGSLGRIADAAGMAVADLFEGPFGISQESLGSLVNQSPEDARTPVFGLIRTFNDVLIRGGSQAGDLVLRVLAAPVVGGIEATVQTAQELGMSRTDARRLRRDLYMGAEVSAAATAMSPRPLVGRPPRVAPTAKPGSLIERMAETGTLNEALQKIPPGQRQGILKKLQRGFDDGQRAARRELDRRGLGNLVRSESGLTNRIGSLVDDLLKPGNRSAEAIRLKLDAGRRLMAQLQLAKFIRDAGKKFPAGSAEKYFATVWDRLPANMRAFLDSRFGNFAGDAGERIVGRTAKDAGFNIDNPKRFDLSEGMQTSERIFDHVTSEEMRKILGGWLVRPVKGTKGTGVEVKVATGRQTPAQRAGNDAVIKKGKISSAELLQLPASQIKPDDLAEVITDWLNNSRRKNAKRPGGVPKAEVEKLIEMLREQRGPDGQLLTIGQVMMMVTGFALPFAFPGETGDAEDGFMDMSMAMS